MYNEPLCRLQYYVLCIMCPCVICSITCCVYNLHMCHLQYFVLVVLIFIVEIVAGVLAFVYRRDIENFLYRELQTGIRKHYPHESQPDTHGLRSAWKFLQTLSLIHISEPTRPY